MPEYRFFFWTEVDDHVAKVEIIDCADDDGAVHWAERALCENRPYLLAEIWKGERLVGRQQRIF